MKVDYLILGQGICGTFLSYFLLQEGKRVMVIDDNKPNTASRVSSGVINPVTGRRVVKSWMIDDIMPFAKKSYDAISAFLEIDTVAHSATILDFVPTPQMLEAFRKRIEDEKEAYLNYKKNTETLREQFNFPFEVVEIKSSLNIQMWELLVAWKQYLTKNNLLLEEAFDWDSCHVTGQGVTYKDIKADKIICCEGVTGSGNPYFDKLPFAFNKGEALIVSIPGLSKEYIYKMSSTIVPLVSGDLFWVGSTYAREYEDDKPTEMFRRIVENYLTHWLKIPFEVRDHLAAIRPANLERRPFVGLHPVHPNVGILNGMGTKGASLAPYFAYQLVHNMLYDKEIEPLADVKRFKGILSK
ncbi:MAG: FAD-binding oxidoreductase [Niabella sp.]